MKKPGSKTLFPQSSDHIEFLRNHNKGIEAEAIQTQSKEAFYKSTKERLTKDVRYQEFREITLDLL